jgi:uncharacterized protein (DUF1800 family)
MLRGVSQSARPFLLSSLLSFVIAIGSAGKAEAQASWWDTARLLDQSTFGPTWEAILWVQEIGFEAYLEEQFAAPSTPYPYLPLQVPNVNICGVPADPDCVRVNFTMWALQTHFFRNALYGPDQLRQRVAFALSQIFVTSGLPPYQYAFWMRPYQQLLYDSAFGNFRTLLYNVTLNPMMGRYLDMVNNRRFNPATGIKPNENYAREILQLFSIGVFQLNQDGTQVLDEGGQPIPTYDQDVIEELSKVFTGWILAPPPAAGVPNYIDPMVVQVNNATQRLALYYEQGEKRLLTVGGEQYVIPSCATPPANCTADDAERDLNLAIDHIYNHPNVAPFISKQLIQKLVTSNPSPAYVARVSAVFDANRGSDTQLQEVVRAILLDEEARGDDRPEPQYGHLTEPVLGMTRFLKMFSANTDGALGSINLGNATSYQIGAAQLDEDVFRAPSVFNFYAPDYEVPGEPGVLGPEFQIYSSMSALRRANFISRLLCLGPGLPASCLTTGGIPPGGTQSTADYRPWGTSVDLTPWATPDTDILVIWMNMALLRAPMSPDMFAIVRNYLEGLPPDPLLRARHAAYLVATSAQHQVER